MNAESVFAPGANYAQAKRDALAARTEAEFLALLQESVKRKKVIKLFFVANILAIASLNDSGKTHFFIRLKDSEFALLAMMWLTTPVDFLNHIADNDNCVGLNVLPIVKENIAKRLADASYVPHGILEAEL